MPKTDPANTIADEPKDFESAMEELQKVVASMESGELSLEASLAAYKRGLELSAFCKKTLEEAELQVQVLEKGIFKDYPIPPSKGGRDD